MVTTCLYDSPCKTGYILYNVSLGSLIAATLLTAICCGISLVRFMENHKYVHLTFQQLFCMGVKPRETLAVDGPHQNILFLIVEGSQNISILLVTKCQRKRKENSTNICKIYYNYQIFQHFFAIQPLVCRLVNLR